jgi:DNA topoisomerase VI subunit B
VKSTLGSAGHRVNLDGKDRGHHKPPAGAGNGRPKAKADPRLNRTTFATSRLLDFCSKKELTAQTGHPPAEWPLVILKELLDNALDACEDAGTPPVIGVHVGGGCVTVTDNGPGIPPETVQGVLDPAVRVSSREAYVSPTRGAQGNALKTLIAMPYALDGSEGRVEVSARGLTHRITYRVDRIRQEPVIVHEREEGPAQPGTKIRIVWPDSARSLLEAAKPRFLQISEDFAFLNPHLTLSVRWGKEKVVRAEAACPGWKKWLPSNLTSAWWYDGERLSRLIAAYLSHDADRGQSRTVRALVAEFDGLTGSAKQTKVLEAVGLKRAPLAALVKGGEVDRVAAEGLLRAMRQHSKPVKPDRLGRIGPEALKQRFVALGCEEKSFTYKAIKGTQGDIPEVLEVAFGYCPKADERRLILGVNWSPGIGDPFRQLGPSGHSASSYLAKLYAGPDAPVVFLLHLARPRVEYTDRGKSAVVVGGDTDTGEEA